MTVPLSQPYLGDTDAPASSVELWIFLVPVLLGFVAVYLLLPRPKNYHPLPGAAAAGLALLAAGWLLIRHGIANAETVLFYSFALIAVAAGGLLVTLRNPVRAALSFALVVLSTCGLFLLQAAPFLMAATLIIYAGAIIVTFIFVIMLAQQAGWSDADLRSREPLLACIAGFVLLGAVLSVLHAAYTHSDKQRLSEEPTGAMLPAQNVVSLGRELFTQHLLAVELAGTLLLVAAIGAIAIAGRRTEGLR